MMRVSVFRLLCTAAVAAVVFAPCFIADPVRAQSLMYGKTGVSVPERTDAGEWSGTWFYVSRLHKMAVWMRDNNGTPELKLRVQGLTGGFAENFTTDWDSSAEYDFRGQHGTFRMSFDRRDADTFEGSWVWDITDEERKRKETVDFTIYRAGRGRQMVWKLADLRREFSGGSSEQTTVQEQLAWSFQKASRREVLWSELPF